MKAIGRLFPLSSLLPVALLAGCASSRPDGDAAAFDPPAVPVRLEHRPGTPWTGPVPAPSAGGAAAAPEAPAPVGLRCRVAIARDSAAVGAENLAPIGTRARLVVADRGMTPMRGSAAWLGDVLVGRSSTPPDLDDAERFGRVVETLTVLPPGVTASVAVDLENGALRRFGVSATRSSGSGAVLVVADAERLVAEGAITPAAAVPFGTPDATATKAKPAAPPPAEEPVAVSVEFDDPIAPGEAAIVLTAPAPFPEHPSARLVVVVEPVASLEPAVAEAALARCRRDVAAADAEERDRGTSRIRERFETKVAAGVFEAMADRGVRRQAIVLLADSCGSTLGGDVAIAADDAALARYAEALAKDLGASAQDPAEGATTFGFEFERATYRFLAALREDGTLGTALTAVLARNAGEAGRFPSTLVELANAATGFEDMGARIADENVSRLDDSSESVRVRAYDWLARREKAPAGYDPLAPRAERRAVLRKLVEAEEAARSAREAAAGGASEERRP